MLLRGGLREAELFVLGVTHEVGDGVDEDMSSSIPEFCI